MGIKGCTHKKGHRRPQKTVTEKLIYPQKNRRRRPEKKTVTVKPICPQNGHRRLQKGKIGFFLTAFLRKPVTVFLRTNRFFRDRFYAYTLYTDNLKFGLQ